MKHRRYKRRDRVLTVTQFDGSQIPIDACTCQPSWVDRYQEYNHSCPIDQHAQRARQDTWEFDDNGNSYEQSAEET